MDASFLQDAFWRHILGFSSRGCRAGLKGQAWFSLVTPTLPGAPEIPLEGFRLPQGALAAACTANGWEFVP